MNKDKIITVFKRNQLFSKIINDLKIMHNMGNMEFPIQEVPSYIFSAFLGVITSNDWRLLAAFTILNEIPFKVIEDVLLAVNACGANQLDTVSMEGIALKIAEMTQVLERGEGHSLVSYHLRTKNITFLKECPSFKHIHSKHTLSKQTQTDIFTDTTHDTTHDSRPNKIQKRLGGKYKIKPSTPTPSTPSTSTFSTFTTPTTPSTSTYTDLSSADLTDSLLSTDENCFTDLNLDLDI